MIARACLALVGFSLLPLSAAADDPRKGLDKYAAHALREWKVPGVAIAVVKNDKVVFARGYGVLKAGKKRSVDENTIFPIASITKSFTATALAVLVDEGKLKWNDPVTKHLPKFRLHNDYVTRNITVADLLSHRTGYERADLMTYRGDHDRAELLRRMRYLKPRHPFRSRYGYNNLMYVAAGQIVENVSGQRWEQFITDRLLKPLKMQRTTTSRPAAETLGNVAVHHTLSGGKLVANPAWKKSDDNSAWNRVHNAVAPAGAIQSSVADLAQYLRLHLKTGRVGDTRLLKAGTVQRMQATYSVAPLVFKQDGKMPYPKFFYGAGLGWSLRDYRGRKVVMHGGSSGAVIAMMPAENLGIAVLANRDRAGIVYMMMHDLFDRFLGIPCTWTTRDWVAEAMQKPADDNEQKLKRLRDARKKNTKPSLPLKNYAGRYESNLYGSLKVTLKNDRLQFRFGPNFVAPATHWETDTFHVRFPVGFRVEWLVTFGNVKNGRPQTIHIQRLFWHEGMPVFHRRDGQRRDPRKARNTRK